MFQVPVLGNNPLLVELRLAENSVTMINGLAAVWLPLLTSLDLHQNRYTLMWA